MGNPKCRVFVFAIACLPLFTSAISAQEPRDTAQSMVVQLPGIPNVVSGYAGKHIARWLKEADTKNDVYVNMGVTTDFSLNLNGSSPRLPTKIVVFFEHVYLDIQLKKNVHERCLVIELEPNTAYRSILIKQVSDSNVCTSSEVRRSVEGIIQRFVTNLMLSR